MNTKGQTLKIFSTDGDIMSVDSSDDLGFVNVTKNNSSKTYVYDLKRAILTKVFAS
jgi:hypothetical protein